ncbi:uncharacterized protein HD556DRAFT_1447571 [Suillus plorans]|uniref:Uncharacterized protein n=1 Tax=Suillus plorans TaxID=116603 RepID=A0A9P7AG25_9AGAM|nr:uncharacterized protein HD556DRAFT_1447571 [Suillus plorans]KAG1788719.1 hypothetical protein HD556DRAFT_1447571 [Suillus plorans]
MPGGHLYLFLQSSSSESSFLRLPHCTLWDDATRAGALDALPHNTRMHLACHGKQDRKQPYHSRFTMRDEPLRLQFSGFKSVIDTLKDIDYIRPLLHHACYPRIPHSTCVIPTFGSILDGSGPLPV